MHLLIWFFFLRIYQHEIKHSNQIQSNVCICNNRDFLFWCDKLVAIASEAATGGVLKK